MSDLTFMKWLCIGTAACGAWLLLQLFVYSAPGLGPAIWVLGMLTGLGFNRWLDLR